MSVNDVKSAFQRVAADQRITTAEVDQVLSALGDISPAKQAELQGQADTFDGIMDADAREKLSDAMGLLNDVREQIGFVNANVRAEAGTLAGEAAAMRAPGVATQSYGGAPLPEAVKVAVNGMIAGGAVAYDVRELKPGPVYDTSHGEGQVIWDGKFNPYSQSQYPADSLAFEHTELTPAKIQDDMSTEQTFNVLAGYQTSAYGGQAAKFAEVTRKGSGNITALYDEAQWDDTFARGPNAEKHASNFAILADGSVHCVPASRRSGADPDSLILTTASLGRGKLMLFNGHLEMRGGVVTYVGLSGRLCKLMARGTKFVDPVELLRAWGFKLAPGLKLTLEG